MHIDWNELLSIFAILAAIGIQVLAYQRFFHMVYAKKIPLRKMLPIYGVMYAILLLTFDSVDAIMHHFIINTVCLILLYILYRPSFFLHMGMSVLVGEITAVCEQGILIAAQYHNGVFSPYSVFVQSGLGASVLLAAIVLLMRWFEKRLGKHPYVLFILAVPICSMILLIFHPSWIVLLTTVLINIVVFYLFGSLERTHAALHRQTVLEEQSAAYRNQLDLIYQSQEQQRFLRHDMKNHLGTMQTLLLNQQYDELMQYMERSVQQLEHTQLYVHSGNSCIDSLLNYKLQIAAAMGTAVSVQIHIPEGLPVEAYDVSVILGNLLDNAIHALQQEQSKVLSVQMDYRQNLLWITIRNSCTCRPEKLLSFSPNQPMDLGTEHGIGLHSVYHVLQAYHGDLQCSYENQTVTVSALLYLQQ